MNVLTIFGFVIVLIGWLVVVQGISEEDKPKETKKSITCEFNKDNGALNITVDVKSDSVKSVWIFSPDDLKYTNVFYESGKENKK